jgi:hypothetical protein
MTKIKGRDATKLFCDSQAAAVDRIEEIQKRSRATEGLLGRRNYRQAILIVLFAGGSRQGASPNRIEDCSRNWPL